MLEKIISKTGVALTLLVFAVAVFVIITHTMATGSWVGRSVDLKGGSEITIKTGGDVRPDEMENFLRQKFPGVEVRSTGTANLLIKTDYANTTEIVDEVAKQTAVVTFSTQTIGPSLGAAFWGQAQLALLLAFVLMGGAIFMIYRDIVPSLTMILCALCDLVETIAVMDILGMNLSLVGLGALLMIIGYASDNNVVLTTKTLKREGGQKFDVIKVIRESTVTGMTMTCTAVVALLAMLLFSPSTVLKELASILLIGLLFDAPNTWIQNAGILRWYVETKS